MRLYCSYFFRFQFRLLRHESGNPVYTYDSHGNMLTMPHLPALQWDFADRLHVATLDANNNKAYYAYNSGGERTRKVVVKGNTTEERIYFGDYEIYRKTVNQQLNFERHTHHVNDDTKKVALTEYKTIENGLTLQVPEVTIRYQYDNHLGSACIELDETAQLITYEEYHPFGTTSYRAGRSLTETSLKRYKYVGKERDEETGLYYYGARYYADWLCRFVSVDPLQFKYPYYTPFQYAGNKPVTFIDLDGMEEKKKTDNPISVGYEYNITFHKYKDTVMAEYINTENRKAVNIEIEIATSIIAELKVTSKVLKGIKELPGIVNDFQQALEDEDFTNFFIQYGSEGLLKLSEFVSTEASKDITVGQNRELFKQMGKNLDKLNSLVSAGFSILDIYREIDSPSTKSEALADLTFYTMDSTYLGYQNTVNTGVFTFNSGYNGKLKEATMTTNQIFRGIEMRFEAFDLTNPEDVKVIKSLIYQSAPRFVYDCINLPKENN